MTETRKITLQFPSLRAFLAEYGERVSSEGMLLRSEVPPAAGTRVEIEVVVAEGMRLLRASGETLWSGASGGQQAAAVRFVELDDASRTLIDKIVDQRRREGAEPFDLANVPGPREARNRELTVPAAASADRPEAPEVSAEAAPAGAGDSVFDLAEPPAPPPLDLLPPPANVEPRPPVPPVPLLADPEPAPFDLGGPPEEAVELSTEGPAIAPESEAPGDPVASEAADLSDLFDGEEAEMAPASGRTEAFPASFVDEVEAELEAADGQESSYLEVDTGELEVRLGASVEDPTAEAGIPVAEPLEALAEVPLDDEVPAAPAPDAVTAWAPPDEFVRQPPVELPEAASRVEEPVRLAGSVGAAAPVGPVSEPTPDVPAASGPVATVETAATPEPPTAAPGEASTAAEEPAREAATPIETEAAPAAADEALAAEAPAPPSGTAEEADATPSLSELPQTMEGMSPQVAQAFAADHGPETVEIPIMQPPPPPAAEEEAEEEPPGIPEEPLDEVPPPVVTAPPAASPPPGKPQGPPVLDDNLLSIPELSAEEPAAEPDEPVDLPSSAESLRGAAGRSRHLGTWLLMGLLVAALAVAGYFIFGLVRGDGETGPRQVSEQAPPPGPAASPSTPDEVSEEAAPSDPGEPAEPVAAPSAGETPAPSGDEPPAAEEPPATEPAAAEEPPAAGPEPAAPLTGLNRITWSESDEGTVLALVGDGVIPRQNVELVPIAGASPRLVIKISGVERAFQPAVLEVGTTHVQRVRTGLHDGAQLHVVVDLAAAGISVRDLAAEGSRLEVRVGPE